MDNAAKAALFSALLFPGWGQFYLKRYKRGLVFVLPVLAGTLALAWAVVQVVITIIKAAPLKKGTFQIGNVLQMTADAFKALDLFYFLLIVFLLLLFWILSIIDAYLLGKKIMTAPTTAAHPELTSDQR
jgi:hypothetical protein